MQRGREERWRKEAKERRWRERERNKGHEGGKAKDVVGVIDDGGSKRWRESKKR